MDNTKSLDVIALGELLIDFTNIGKSEFGMQLYERNPGGAPANVACTVAKLGLKTSFIGKIGNDPHGEYLRQTLESLNVDASNLTVDPNVYTTLAFVELSDEGERSFSFSRKPGADSQLNLSDLPQKILTDTKIFHFGSLSLTEEPSRSSTIEALSIARDSGSIISYDPNYRNALWASPQEAYSSIRGVLCKVNLAKMSLEEARFLSHYKTPEDTSLALLDEGIDCVIVTLGGGGAFIRTNTFATQVKAYQVQVVDTTGAGDAFLGGFLYKLLTGSKQFDSLSLEDAQDYVSFANATAALCIQKRGAISALPTLKDVESFIQKQFF